MGWEVARGSPKDGGASAALPSPPPSPQVPSPWASGLNPGRGSWSWPLGLTASDFCRTFPGAVTVVSKKTHWS